MSFSGTEYLNCPIGRVNIDSGVIDDETKLHAVSQLLVQYRDLDHQKLGHAFAYSPDGSCLVVYDKETNQIVRRSVDHKHTFSSVLQRIRLLEICSISRTGRFVLWRDGSNLDENPLATGPWCLLDFTTGAVQDINCDFDDQETPYYRPIFSTEEDHVVWITRGFDRHAVEVQKLCICQITSGRNTKRTSSLCTNLWNFSFTSVDRPVYTYVAGQIVSFNTQELSDSTTVLDSLWLQGYCLKQSVSDNGRRLAFLGMTSEQAAQTSL